METVYFYHQHYKVVTIKRIKDIVSFAEANEINIGPAAVRLHWPVLSNCWMSVEIAEIPIGVCNLGALTALPDHLLIL